MFLITKKWIYFSLKMLVVKIQHSKSEKYPHIIYPLIQGQCTCEQFTVCPSVFLKY